MEGRQDGFQTVVAPFPGRAKMVEHRKHAAKSGHADARNPPGFATGYRFADFICIGAQKAGTTWLDKNLRLHPDIWMPPIKELNYFNELYIPSSRRWTAAQRRKKGTELLERYLKNTRPEDRDCRLVATIAQIVDGNISDDWYGRIFDLAAPRQLCGEIAPDYSLLPAEGISHAIRLMPNLKVILLIRDPIERSWSHIRMVARSNSMTSLRDLLGLARNPDMLARSDYLRIASNWARFVPDSRIREFATDEIQGAPMAVLESLCSFVGARFNAGWFTNASVAVHVGDTVAMPADVHELLKQQLRSVYAGIQERYPRIAAPWVAKHY